MIRHALSALAHPSPGLVMFAFGLLIVLSIFGINGIERRDDDEDKRK